MKTFILSGGCFSGVGLEELSDQADFRRTTRNMQMAYLAAEDCLKPLGPEFSKIRDRCGLVLGTSHGELGATVDFLSEIGKSGTARPIVFQSSLHNATLGFLSKIYGLTGACLTVSDGPFTGEEALSEACLFIEAGVVDACLVIGVDGKVPAIESLVQRMYPKNWNLTEGAGALLLINEAGLETLDSKASQYILKSLQLERTQVATEGLENRETYYDSIAVELLAREFSHRTRIDSAKPDGSYSCIEIQAR